MILINSLTIIWVKDGEQRGRGLLSQGVDTDQKGGSFGFFTIMVNALIIILVNDI